MTRLSKLRKRLARLRRRRRGVRWSMGYSALAVAMAWALLAAFLVDWLLEMNRAQRVVALAICLSAVWWAFRRFTRPWLGHREGELEMALLVERRQQIDSDLVAALQFESPEAPEWGSVRLEREVIEGSVELARRLDLGHGFSTRRLMRRAAALTLTAAALAIGIWRFPDHAGAFLRRFFLLDRTHYPTQTVIETIRINGRRIDLAGWQPGVAKNPYGQPVRFEVTCSGRLPSAGNVTLKSDPGLRANLALESAEGRRGVYAGVLARLIDPVEYQIYLGDAWTDRARLEVVPLPTVDVEFEVTPPSYAAGRDKSSQPSGGLRQISVIEGSRVGVRLRSDKPLRKATLSIDGQAYEMARHATGGVAATAGGERWVLAAQETPLSRVVEPLRYSIQVVDVDRLELERPIEGVVRIQADHGPQVVASAITQFVLPTARPSVSCDASDDYGLSRVWVLPEVVHEDGRAEELEPIVLYEVSEQESPPRAFERRRPIDLGPLELAKGDELTLTVEAVDYRGRSAEGKAARSEPLVFQVTDERGILAAMSETDQESAGRLEIMIQRQIEVGEGR